MMREHKDTEDLSMELRNMTEKTLKTYPTLGCCGLDCGLCPRHYTEGTSRCPGCCGPDFAENHPSCGIITCCVKNHGLEVCADCFEWPCDKFDPKIKDGGEYDSFVTYQNVHKNMEFIKKHGVEKLIFAQSKRIEVLETILNNFDDGRSKTYFCTAVNLLPLRDLDVAMNKAKLRMLSEGIKQDDKKTKAKILKEALDDAAGREGIELRLRKKDSG
jgi:hypothetical protein